MFFRDIIGQEQIKKRLIESVKNGHIAHAQLFAGPEGVGKLQLALAYARYIQCTDRNGDDACGHCPSCIKYNKLMHPDLHFVFPVFNKKGKSSSTTVCDDFIGQWREWVTSHTYFSCRDWLQFLGADNQQGGIFVKEGDEIIRKLAMKPYESDYKIMIIWLPEKMNEQTANRILKVLEEPYPGTIFLLVSNEPQLLLSTILSRTQQIHVHNIDEEMLAQALNQKFGLAMSDCQDMAHLANGNVLKAIETINTSEERVYQLELFKQMMRLAYARKLKDMKKWSEEVASLGRERQKNFLNYAQHMIRENFIMNFRQPQLNYQSRDEEAFSSRFFPFVNERNTVQIMEELDLAERQISQNVNAKMVFFDMAIRFIMLLKTN